MLVQPYTAGRHLVKYALTERAVLRKLGDTNTSGSPR